MKTFKTVQRNYSDQIVDSHTCDICGDDVEPRDNYSVDCVTISHESGMNFPESRNTRLLEWDVCGDCFTKNIVPLLIHAGLETRETDTGD